MHGLQFTLSPFSWLLFSPEKREMASEKAANAGGRFTHEEETGEMAEKLSKLVFWLFCFCFCLIYL